MDLFSSPEEIVAQVQRNQMLAQDSSNRITQMVDDLLPEQLAVLRDIMQRASQEDLYAAYMEGIFSASLHIKYPEHCPGCGGNHPDHEESLGIAQPPVKEASAKERLGNVPYQQPALFEDDNVATEEESPLQILQDQLTEYGVTPIDTESMTGPVTCNGCGIVSPNLEDRMLREPGIKGCSGCQQKAKWG